MSTKKRKTQIVNPLLAALREDYKRNLSAKDTDGVAITECSRPRNVTARKLRRIFRYLQKHKIPVKIRYVWVNSIGQNVDRSYQGVIDKYTIDVTELYDYKEFDINITFADGSKLREYINNQWEFDPSNPNKRNKVRLYYCNSGPYCYFTIKRLY